ncbi:uncharacterized protein LOC102806683 [Saccoglossus kowalevskii]|uniref:WW domain-binding protein 1-like n=1 Tax=Saccoglossus kowalevskii TaxID=10224 RepID=A0ABM0MR63_SACKO|nr:PREDICTED: WW domain-binding protein 1-like [Saccoglossus kowalevskii]
MGMLQLSSLIWKTAFLQTFFGFVQAREFCRRENYWCETGHCCGDGQCCNYYYELWWFWVIWIIVLLIAGCCAWQRRRVRKLMRQQARQAEAIQTVIQNTSPSQDWPTIIYPPCKLPNYSEIGTTIAFGTPPPPYQQLTTDQADSQEAPHINVEAVPCRVVTVTVHQSEIGTQTRAIDDNQEQTTNGSSSVEITPDISPNELKVPLSDSLNEEELGATSNQNANSVEVAMEIDTPEAEDVHEDVNGNRSPVVPRFRDTVVELSGNHRMNAARV